ncbi:hypothetical protein LOZ53_000431 [Ophidiomyces ophidiicola]|nr:hypothetical protein LOZ55_002219 [Ophidiomyces ophidiicola]KAI1991567.1 hypothetical protein LOZ54_002067 [Ophidiomyces ophidiicola]KAI1993475.1 hypothetical protein LOZ51_003854 [Ophidiomyces ophidiicola]KAI1997613.1 hypothetical protein LOZ53_000431 [Ophidiomyces ophidiicola]
MEHFVGAGDDKGLNHLLASRKESGVEPGVNVEDYLLPRTLTQRLAKGVLPPNTSIHRDALLAITKAATVFVSYLSSHANEETDKKTITPHDILSALKEIEFESFCPRLERELDFYAEATAYKQRSKNDKGPSDKLPNRVMADLGDSKKELGNKRVKLGDVLNLRKEGDGNKHVMDMSKNGDIADRGAGYHKGEYSPGDVSGQDNEQVEEEWEAEEDEEEKDGDDNEDIDTEGGYSEQGMSSENDNISPDDD